jgi:DNA-binding IclR family transcriptional regulator
MTALTQVDDLSTRDSQPASSLNAVTAGALNAAEGKADAERRRDTMAERTLTVLSAFSSRSVLGVSDVALLAQLPKSTAHRLLTVLTQAGYVARVDDRYCLSGRTFELGNLVRACRPNGLRTQAVPFMSELFAQTGQVVHLAVLDSADVLYLEKIFGHGSAKCPTWVGARRQAYTTALGKVLLAHRDPADTEHVIAGIRFNRHTPYTIASRPRLEQALAQVRQDGWAADFEESVQGLSCVAAPVLNPHTKDAVAALSVTTVAVGDSVKRFRKPLVEAAQRLSAQLVPALA